jgi:hypothetical protein
MDLKQRALLVRELRFDLKQGVDMTARPPSRAYTDDERRVQRSITRRHPLNESEAEQAGKLSAGGQDPYNAYWAIRNNRYDSNGRRRRMRRTRKG